MEKIIKRKDIRLKQYDYSQEGYYFITICTRNRRNILSKIKVDKNCRGVHCTSELSYIGKVVDKYLQEIENIHKNIKIDEYIIMPNHVHILLIIKEKRINTISKIIQQFKGKVTKEIKCLIWQKLFYEHIIQSEKEYLYIKEYIKNNPINWREDTYY